LTEKRIRVLQIIKSLGRGGAEMLLPETLRLHDHKRFEFHYIYFLPWKNQMVESLRLNGGKVTCVEAKNNAMIMLQARKVASYVRENNIEIIHSHLPWAGILSRLVARLTRIPVVYTEHNKQERYHFLTRKLNLLSMNALTKIVAVSKDVADSIQKHKSTLQIPLCTILNGVDTEKFQRDAAAGEAIKRDLGIPNDAPVIGTVAVFRFQKRLDLWLEAAKQILQEKPNCHFIVVGDGPLKSEIRKKCEALRLGHRVHFVGLQAEVRPYYSAFTIYMMTSIFEGLPIALLEAMSMQCAIVTTNAGGIKEVVRSDIDGLCVDVDAWQSVVSGVLALLNDKEKLAILARSARNRAIHNFSLSSMVQQLENMYQTMYKNHNQPF
jgi:L-malate glycosyltransferase